ncbi:MAG: hypothetical protein HY795_17305 [Desulfovibrio sp.]|nr:hypothetical protein [Desulfovibrio sp.]
MKLHQFLTALWGSPPPQGALNIWRKADKSTQSFALPDEFAQIGSLIQQTGTSPNDLYHQVGLQAQKTGAASRGTADTCVAIPGFWMDIDILGSGHKATELPPDQDAAMALLDEFPLPPSLIIHSGGGLQVYWLFSSPWVFASQADRDEAQSLSKNTQAALLKLAQGHGWKLDNTSDLVRLLRIPGTFNAKDPSNLREVRVLCYEPERRYTPEDFEQFVPVASPVCAATTQVPTVVVPRPASLLSPSADGKLILEHCAWMAHCRDDAASLPEPEWYAMLSVVAACENGREFAHALSSPHSGYSQSETDRKFEHARITAGPRTCDNIRTQLNGAAYCDACVFSDFVKSPVVLGSNPDRTKALLDVASGLTAVHVNPASAFNEDFVAAMAMMSRQDPALFSKVRAVLAKMGVAVRRLDQMIQAHAAHASHYLIQGGELYFDRGSGITTKIANFVAEITEEEAHDDGLTVNRSYRIRGTAADGSLLGDISIPCADYPAMTWVDEQFGHRAIITPNCQAHMVAAIKYLSLNKCVPSKTVFKHTGWRNDKGVWRFLTGSGALGVHGLDTSVVVDVGSWASAYALPDVPANQPQLHDAMAKAEGLLGFLPAPLAYALFSAVFRAPLAEVSPVDFSLYLEGKTGSFKSECAAVMLGFFGPQFHGKSLPGSWSSTDNALVLQAFTLKDIPFVVDDFNPVGTLQDVNAWHRKADRVFRAQGNLAPRGRMNQGGSMRPMTPPRGMIVSTGEDLPNGHSLQARLVILHLKPGDVDKTALSALQVHRGNGLLASVMAAFIQHLAGQMGTLPGQLKTLFAQLRAEAASKINAHTRTPDNIASLAIGYQMYLEFAVQVGFIQAHEKQVRWEKGWQALIDLGASQGGNLQDEDPIERFGDLLASAILGGHGHLQDKQGNQPSSPQTQGWRNHGDQTSPSWIPQGPLVGYIDGNDLYLLADNAFAAVQQLARTQGGAYPLSKAGLIRRLKDAGKIVSHDSNLNTVRLSMGTGRVRVLHVHAAMIGVGTLQTQPVAQVNSPLIFTDFLGQLRTSQLRG